MLRLAYIAVSATLLFSADVSQGNYVRQPASEQTEIPAGQNIPVLPDFGSSSGPGAGQNPAQNDPAPNGSAPGSPAEGAAQGAAVPHRAAAAKTQPLQEKSRLEILRYVSGEFARMVASLPAGKKGVHIKAGEPLDSITLQKAIAHSGAALNSGDNVQITKVDFGVREIVIELNGGGGAHDSWRNHIQLGVGGMPTSTTTTQSGGPVVTQKAGATLYLDFGRPLPDMSADELKSYLSAVMDFSNQRSAAVQWVQSLPSKTQEAIHQKRAEVGMGRDEVLAAMGRPDRKVREQQPDGTDTEDWIYGYPPDKTVFVRFADDKVIQIDQYP